MNEQHRKTEEDHMKEFHHFIKKQMHGQDRLDEIGIKHGTDKSSHHHGYLKIYERYFERLRHSPITLMELGYGGYHFPDRGGGGAKMWQEYFWQGNIISVDFYKKDDPKMDRLQVLQCSQDDEAGLKEIIYANGYPDIIIDDASHINPLTIRSFEILFPLLKQGGIYVVEDVHSSYWEEGGFQGSTDVLNLKTATTMNYFKMLTDGLNPEHLRDAYNMIPIYGDIESIHFYHQLIFIFKKQP